MFLEKQPKALYFISAANLWERFGYYTTRSILVLYMIKILLFSHEKAYSTFAAFTALLYLAPLIGGHLADNFLGSKHSVLAGGLLLAVGYFLLAIPGLNFFYFALAIVILGNGFYMPNIASVLGQFYTENDARREGGFSILYAAVNIGAFVPPLITAAIIALYDWKSAFLIAALGTLLGTIIFYFCIFRQTTLFVIKKIKMLYFMLGITSFAYLTALLLKHPNIANKSLFLFGGF